MRILIGDRQSHFCESLKFFLKRKDYFVQSASEAPAINELLIKKFNLLIIDTALLTETCDVFLKRLKNHYPLLKVIFLSEPGYQKFEGDLSTFSNLVVHLQKPIKIESIYQSIVNMESEESGAETSNNTSSKAYLSIDQFPSVHRNPTMKKAYQLLKSIGQTDMTVLISGESGVGKEIIARSVYQMSNRRKKEFVGLNCASVPGPLLETELFGAEKGAYTGANARRIGKFEQAQNGTLLLDEISEMDLNLQTKLLRVIQEKEVYRVGGDQKITLDVRLIATTNRNLKEWVKSGNFREDLYYRLNVISIFIPPLRERKEDIPLLAEHIMEKYNQRHPEKKLTLSLTAMEQLEKYAWPGNVRELENIIIRSAYLARGDSLQKIYFDEAVEQINVQDSQLLSGTIEEMERKMIFHALTLHGGNRIKASNQLGISVRTLRNKLRLYREQGLLKSFEGLSDSLGEGDGELAASAKEDVVASVG